MHENKNKYDESCSSSKDTGRTGGTGGLFFCRRTADQKQHVVRVCFFVLLFKCSRKGECVVVVFFYTTIGENYFLLLPFFFF